MIKNLEKVGVTPCFLVIQPDEASNLATCSPKPASVGGSLHIRACTLQNPTIPHTILLAALHRAQSNVCQFQCWTVEIVVSCSKAWNRALCNVEV